MTQTAPKPITPLRYPRRHASKGSRFLGMIRTTDPMDIAILYLVTSFAFFIWFPKMTGRMMDETLGKIHFWGDVHRLPHDVPGAALAGQRGLSTLPFIWNVFKSCRYGRVVEVDDPWGFGNSLEWATSCPPPRHNFTELPRIRSERPAFELHYPHLVQQYRDEAHAAGRRASVRATRSGRHEPNPANPIDK